jgi:integration host factor beta subunit
MNKNTLIENIAEKTQLTKKDTEQVIDTILTGIADALAKGENVDVRGFGSFQVNGKKERQGRNPRTGEAITIAPRNVVVFKPSKELAGRVNGGAIIGDVPDGATSVDDIPAAQLSEGSAKVHGDKLDL